MIWYEMDLLYSPKSKNGDQNLQIDIRLFLLVNLKSEKWSYLYTELRMLLNETPLALCIVNLHSLICENLDNIESRNKQFSLIVKQTFTEDQLL